MYEFFNRRRQLFTSAGEAKIELPYVYFDKYNKIGLETVKSFNGDRSGTAYSDLPLPFVTDYSSGLGCRASSYMMVELPWESTDDSSVNYRKLHSGLKNWRAIFVTTENSAGGVIYAYQGYKPSQSSAKPLAVLGICNIRTNSEISVINVQSSPTSSIFLGSNEGNPKDIYITKIEII